MATATRSDTGMMEDPLEGCEETERTENNKDLDLPGGYQL